MSFETLVVACIIFGIIYLLIRYIVPPPAKQVAYWILLGAGAIWVVTHIHALLHCCSS